jgi:hypothetical protein
MTWILVTFNTHEYINNMITAVHIKGGMGLPVSVTVSATYVQYMRIVHQYDAMIKRP